MQFSCRPCRRMSDLGRPSVYKLVSLLPAMNVRIRDSYPQRLNTSDMISASIPVDVSCLGIVSQFLSAYTLPYLAAFLLASLLLPFIGSSDKNGALLNPNKVWELTNTRAKKEFVTGAREMIGNWFKLNPDKPARVLADVGEITVLPPHMAEEIRNDGRLSFAQYILHSFHGRLPGFNGFREGGRDSGIVQTVIIKDLTKQLNKVTEPIAAETAMTIPGLLTENEEWHCIPLKDTILKLISRITSRVFLGDLLCRNEEWLELTRDYTIHGFAAAEELRLWPAAIRPIVHWFLPRCRKLRALVKKARRIIQPVLEERRQLRNTLSPEGEPLNVIDDAIEWFERAANGQPYDPVSAQLLLSVAAIHTTTDLTCQTLTQLAKNPEILGPLRREIIEVLQEHGWKKTSLYNMKLLDSVIKESQRLKPVLIGVMRRVALDEVRLSDGTVVPKNGQLCVSGHRMWDKELYETPDEFDGYRFYKMREKAEGQTKAQLVTTGPEHLAWGHGKHACPGRFFAANEVKITLIYLLLRYDWKIAEGQTPKIQRAGFSTTTDPHLKMMIRRRQEEIVI